MNSTGDGKHEPADPENAVRVLELELMRERAARQQAGTPYRGLRVASLVFFFAVILGAALAFYYVFYCGGLEEFRSRTAPSSSTQTTSPAP